MVLQFDIDFDGKMENIRLVEASHDIFVRNALYAASKYIYEPPTKDGKRTAVQGVRVRIEFKLADNKENEQRDAI